MLEVISCLLWFSFTALWQVNNFRANFSKPKSIVACTRAFSRAWCRLHIITSYFDWLITLFASTVIRPIAFSDHVVQLIDCIISKKQAISYSTRACVSLIVPRFNTCYIRDSLAYRGSVLWNAVTCNFSALGNDFSHRDLRLKLKS